MSAPYDEVPVDVPECPSCACHAGACFMGFLGVLAWFTCRACGTVFNDRGETE
jgi:hypothetical protein